MSALVNVLENTIDLTQYGITNVAEVVYNPSYELLFEEETKAGLSGYDKGVVTESRVVSSRTMYLSFGERPVNIPVSTATAPDSVTTPLS